MPGPIFDETYHFLGKSLNVATKRHGLISGNIANLDTVGYTPKDIDFKKTLEMEMEKGEEKLSRTNARHYKVGTDTSIFKSEVDSDGFNSEDPVTRTSTSGYKVFTCDKKSEHGIPEDSKLTITKLYFSDASFESASELLWSDVT